MTRTTEITRTRRKEKKNTAYDFCLQSNVSQFVFCDITLITL